MLLQPGQRLIYLQGRASQESIDFLEKLAGHTQEAMLIAGGKSDDALPWQLSQIMVTCQNWLDQLAINH